MFSLVSRKFLPMRNIALYSVAHTYFVPEYNLPQTHFDPKHTLAPRHSKSCLKIRPYLLVSAKASYEILRHSRDNTLIGRPPPVTMLRNHYTKEVKRIRDAHKNYDFDTFTFTKKNMSAIENLAVPLID